MRVANPDTFSDTEKIVWAHYGKPIIVPRIPVITNEKQRDKLTKQIESYVRQSMEYKDLIKYLRTNIDMNSCEFYSNINATGKKGLIEIHHEPFDLYTLTSIVMKKHEAEVGFIDELMVAEEVTRLHYEGKVGLIPLAITPHELVHKGKLFIPLNCVRGRFVEFVKDYFEYIDDAYISILSQKIDLTKNLDRGDTTILNVRYVYTDVDGYNLPQIMDEKDVA